MSTDEQRKKGLEMVQEVYAGGVTLDPEMSPHQAYTVDHVFGWLWARPQLSLRDRRMVVIGILASLGKTEILETQFRAALAKGELTPEQIEEIALHVTHYIGSPQGGATARAAENVLGKKKKPAAG